MQVTREDLNPCTVKLNVVCSPEQVKDAFEKALKSIAKEIRLPGFRPGHAPKHMVDKLINPEELYRQAADELVRRTYDKAVKDQSLEVDAGVRPSVELTELDRDSSKGAYTAKVPLPPKIKLAEYKGLNANRPPVAVTDEEVDFQIDELRKRKSSRESITNRSAAEGDYGVVNIKPEGDAGEGKNFMVVLGQTFEGLDSALKGMNAEEMKTAELTFPDTFQESTWAGRKMKVQLTLNSISAVILPELDEEFAKSLKTDSVDELRAKMRESIEEAKKQMSNDMLQEQLLEQLREASDIQVSDNMWEALANQRLSEIAQQQAQQGKSMEQYAAENGMVIDDLVKAWHEQAKVHVERAMVVREILAAEKLPITNEELNNELFMMAQEFQMEPMELLEAMRRSGSLQELQFRAVSRKVTNFLIENANITEGDAPAAAAKPAKKTAAKNADSAEEAPKKKAPAKKKAE